MFPFVRMIKDTWLASRQPPFKSLTETHVSHHICWPHDLDFWLELKMAGRCHCMIWGAWAWRNAAD